MDSLGRIWLSYPYNVVLCCDDVLVFISNYDQFDLKSRFKQEQVLVGKWSRHRHCSYRAHQLILDKKVNSPIDLVWLRIYLHFIFNVFLNRLFRYKTYIFPIKY